MVEKKTDYCSLLNIPPEMAGSMSPSDVAVLLDQIRKDIKRKGTQFRSAQKTVTQRTETIKDKVQNLVDEAHRLIAKKKDKKAGEKPVLAEILENSGLKIAGENISGLILRNVDGSDVDFSGSNLSAVNARKMEVCGAIFSSETIINRSTKLDELIGADKAIGLFECLKANFDGNHNLRKENPAAWRLMRNLEPKKPAQPQQNNSALSAASEKTCANTQGSENIPQQNPAPDAAAPTTTLTDLKKPPQQKTRPKYKRKPKDSRGLGRFSIRKEYVPRVRPATNLLGEESAVVIDDTDARIAELCGTKTEAKPTPTPPSNKAVSSVKDPNLDAQLQEVTDRIRKLLAQYSSDRHHIGQRVHAAVKDDTQKKPAKKRAKKTHRLGSAAPR